MKLRFISSTMHGIVDYSAALALIVSPFVLQLGVSNPIALWLSVVVGIGVVIESTNTIYKYGLFNTIPFSGHLAIDLAAATVFLAAPFVFNFQGIDLYYYIVNAGVVYLVVALSESNTKINSNNSQS